MQYKDEKNLPLASIIIPNYNHARYVADAIQSVLAQDYHNYEIIVVDDGSTDNSREVIDQFGDRVRYLYQENVGLSAARNTGIRASRGELIGVLDADDMYEPHYLSTLVAKLQQNPDADGVYCGYQFVDHDGSPLPQIEARHVPCDRLYETLLEGNFFVPESIFLRRYVYENVGFFDEELRACEDWDMWLRVTKKYKIIFSTEILTRHRILPGSMSADPLRMITNRLLVLKKNIGPEPTDGGTETHRAYGRAYLSSCVEYLQHSNNDCAYDLFQRMAHICPSLLNEVDTYYQLGCGNQPKGFMGDLHSLDIKKSGLQLTTMMTCLFHDRQTRVYGNRVKDMAFAQAYYVLGLLGYGARQFQEARRFFARAASINPRFMLQGPFTILWLKTLASPRIIDGLKGLRLRLQAAHNSLGQRG